MSYPPTQGCTSPLGYCGGPIVSNPEVVQVSWTDPGASGVVAAAVESYLQTWWPAILSPQAGYLGWLTEYGTVGRAGKDGLPGSNQSFAGAATYLGLYRITPSTPNQGSQLDDANIRAELAAQILAGNLPAPTCDASGRCDTLYMIDLPPSVTAVTRTFGGTTEQSCSSFCGYHLGTTYAGKTIGYAVFPDPTVACPQCAPDGLEPDLGAVHSHELAEAITDVDLFLENLTPTSTDCMRPGAWDQLAPGCGEIGDSCAWPSVVPSITIGGLSYYVQGLFDNARMDCEVAGPTQACTTSAGCAPPTPVCDPTGLTCRACLPGDCAGATPACSTTGPHAGSCVVCASFADCQGHLNAPICDGVSNVCRPCEPSDCTGLTPVCATNGGYAGRCVECASRTDCPASAPACDPITYTCEGCVSSADCEGYTPVCEPSTHRCAPCTQDAQCSSSRPICDVPSGACVPCTTDASCASTPGDGGAARDAAVNAAAEGGGASDAGLFPGISATGSACSVRATGAARDSLVSGLLVPLVLAGRRCRRWRRQGR